MSYNGSGTFNINTTGQPVVAGTVISSSAFNALTTDLATGLTTAITKDGQTTTTARITFAQGLTSSLVTDSSSVSTGSIITAGGVGIAKNLYVGVNANVAGTLGVTGVATFSAAPIYSSLTASSAVATDASKGLVSVTNTGTGNNVLATSPTLVTPILGTPQSGTLTNCTGLPTTALTGAITEANGGTGTTTGYYGFKNRIINGAMVIDQRNAGASVTPTSTSAFTFGTDRWSAICTNASKFSMQQNAASVTPPAGYVNYLGFTSLATTSLAAGDYYFVNQVVEGFNMADLAWGTANAATVTLSFRVYSSLTGTFGGALTNGTRSYPFSYSIPTANTWTAISVTFAGDTSGTWATNNALGMRVQFSLGAGSTYSGTAGSWQTANLISATGATSVVGTNGATFYITGVQLEKGSTATSFDYRPYGTELSLCQRYVWVYSGNSYAYARGPVLNVSTTSTIWYMQYPTTMRSAPSLSLNNITSSTIEFSNYTTGTSPTYSSSVFNESSIWGGSISFATTGTTFTTGSVGNWRWTGAPSANFTFSAEL